MGDHKRKKMQPGPAGEGEPEPHVESTLHLLTLAQQGDAEALNRLYTRYLPRLQRWASGRIPSWARDMGDTGDLVQETVVATLGRLNSFEMRHDGALRAYMRQAIVNHLRNLVRNRKVRPPSVEIQGNEADNAPSPLEQTIGREVVESYEAAIGKLRDEEREAVHMRIELKCTYREIAEALGKPSDDAARMTVSRALVRLAKEMGREG